MKPDRNTLLLAAVTLLVLPYAVWTALAVTARIWVLPGLGIGCNPVIIKGEKAQFLDWLSWAVESGAINFPVRSGPIQWPKVSLKEIFTDIA